MPGTGIRTSNRVTGLASGLHSHLVAIRFADFVIDNFDLAQQLMSHFNGDRGDSFAIVTELERRAMRWRE